MLMTYFNFERKGEGAKEGLSDGWAILTNQKYNP